MSGLLSNFTTVINIVVPHYSANEVFKKFRILHRKYL